MKMVKFVQVVDSTQINQVVELADKIWHEHYSAMIDEKQIDYMLEKFLSQEAIKEQIRSQNYQYYLLNVENIEVGFIGIKEESEEHQLFLSKLYIQKNYRGHGLGNEAFAFLEEICNRKKYKKLWLTVNRYNESSIHTYEKKGFIKASTQVSDIGHGYVMDDYVMEKIFRC